MSNAAPAPSSPPPPSSGGGPTWLEVAQQRRYRRRGFSLRARLLIYFTLLVFSSLSITAWLLTERNEDAGRKMLTELSRSLGQSVATSAAPLIARGDLAGLQRIADDLLEARQLRQVRFNDPLGNPILDVHAPDAPTPAHEPEKLVSVTTPVAAAIRGAKPGAETRELVGEVVLGVSTASLERNKDATLQAVSLVAFGVTFCAIVLVWVFMRRSMRPMRQLLESARRVVAGDLDATIHVDDTDVVADLATAFNELIAWIRAHRAQLAAASDAMAASIAELERKVEHRTAQLEAANSRLSGEIAEKEDFLRAVSHDLNAPLRNIGGMVTMLMMKNRDALPAEVVQRLERIQKNVEVETDLINELLELSRIKTRRQSLERVETEALVWDLRGVFENDLKTRHIDVLVETSLPDLYAERARIRQVFQNLIDNAIKYMGEDRPLREIRVGCRVTMTEAEFYVRDTGMGIHPEDIDKVFCVFRRGRGEVAQKVPGKGVGLSSVKSIIETYAGRIWVESQLGQGTTFRFTINGKYVPAVSGDVPRELSGPTHATPTLAGPGPTGSDRQSSGASTRAA